MHSSGSKVKGRSRWHVLWYPVITIVAIDLIYQILISWRQSGLIEKSQPGLVLFAAICQLSIYTVMVAPMREFYAASGIRLTARHAFSLLAMGLTFARIVPLGDYVLWRTGFSRVKEGASATTQWYVMYYTWAGAALLSVFLTAEATTFILHPHARVHSLVGDLAFLPITISVVVAIALFATRFGWVREQLKRIAFDRLGSQALSPFGIIRDRKLSANVLGIFTFAALSDWLLEGYTLYLCLRAVGINMPITIAIFGFTFARLFSLVPLLPGGIGQMEAGSVLFFAAYGYSFNPVLTATVLYRLVSYWPALVIGATSYFMTSRHDQAMASMSFDPPVFAGALHHRRRNAADPKLSA